MNRRETGSHYEELAARYLEEQQYKILEKNYRIRTGEIDLIAMDGTCLVFVEVKYRKDHSLGDPLEAVDIRKQRRICQTARYYIYKKGYDQIPCRFDVIGITGTQIRHIKNAFESR